MTIKEVKEEVKNILHENYQEIEVYEANCRGKYYPSEFHTDNCISTDDYTDESEVGFYELMDEEDYNDSIMANTSECADFNEWYGDKEAKILCIMLADFEEEEDDEKENEEELQEILEEYYESCTRTGHHNMMECARYFCTENSHMKIDETEVLEILKKIDNEWKNLL